MSKQITIALAGNPNSGKTTTFNALTGARQHVGNYPGVTVEHKEGICSYQGNKIKVIDLPGTYSLTAFSAEELVTRKFLLTEKVNVVIDIIDASNLERNLYLAVQLLEFNIPLVLALNMIDVAKARGFNTDVEHLSRLLGIPVIPTVASNKEGVNKLLDTVLQLKEGKISSKRAVIDYGAELEEEIGKIQKLLVHNSYVSEKYPLRWVTLKLLENDKEAVRDIAGRSDTGLVMDIVGRSRQHIQSIFNDDVETVITDRRYGFIEGAYHESTQITLSERQQTSDIIDKVLTNRALSLPIFFGLMWLVYQITFFISEIPSGWIETGIQFLGNILNKTIPANLFKSMLIEGIIAGVGNVLVLLPPMLMLFLAIALLEDTGYMARVAFIMDKIMHKMGLHGKSVIPMIIGFGCGVPAIMATRTLSSRKDRLITMLIIPLMSCSARFPVYAMFIGAFFEGKQAGNVLFSIYLLGMGLAVILARFFRRFLFPGPSAPFVMELPPYRMPTLKGLSIHMWERSRLYLKKAGTIILAASIIIWFIGKFPQNREVLNKYAGWQKQIEAELEQKLQQVPPDQETRQKLHREYAAKLKELANRQHVEISRHTIAGKIGQGLVPILRPLGLGDWKVGMALFSGFVAKEVVVSTFATLYQLGDVEEDSLSLRQAIRQDPVFRPLTAYTLMVFILLYIPCISTVAALKKESGGWQWPLFTICYTTILAWIVAFVIYQGGLLLGI